MSWRVVCQRYEVPADRGWPVRVDDVQIAVFESDGELRAVSNHCLHLGSPLDDGPIRDGCVICPWHGWRYDLKTGEQLTVFGRRPALRTYPVRVDGDDVLIDL